LAHQKSSQPTKTPDPKDQHPTGNWRRLAIVAAYLLLFVIASYIFYRRYPNNYTQPNFYAEDGQVFAKNLIGGGFFHSLGTTFNGYYIWGIYIVEKIGFMIDRLFYGGQFANLPRSFALASYMFLGLIATLPALLLRKYLRPMALIIMTLLIIFVPMTGWDYAVIGTIGNLKFAFVFIAFLLLVYRHLMPENSKKVYLVDLGLLICAYTDITVYILMLFALMRYLPKLKTRNFARELSKDKTFQSLVVLGIALLPQLVVIKLHGVPALPGYLDSPYQFGRTVEIFISRSYLYSVLFPINKFLNDATVVILGLLLLIAGFYSSRRNRPIFLFAVFAVFITTFTFVIKRTGISAFYPSYKAGGGPDQFFYAQNWIFDFILSVVIVELIAKLRSATRIVAYIIIFCLVGFVLIPRASTYGSSNSGTGGVGTIYNVGKKDCDTKSQAFNLVIYPSPSLFYSGVTRQQLCTPAVVNYYPRDHQ